MCQGSSDPGRVAPHPSRTGRCGREISATFRTASTTVSNVHAAALDPGFPTPPLSQPVPLPVRTSANFRSSRQGPGRGRHRLRARVELRGWAARHVHIHNQAPLRQRAQREDSHNNHNSDTGRGVRVRSRRKGGGRRRGGERRPRARSGPGGGGRLRPYRKLIRKVPSYATTSSGFPATGGVSATGTRCSVSPIELQHMRKGLRRVYR